MNDHNNRLHRLEKFQAKLIGLALAASVMISASIAWIQGIFGGS